MIETPQYIEGLPKRTSGFDFLIGEWNVANRRLKAPLAGRQEWYETGATATATTLHNGAISIDEMWFPELGIAGSSIRVHTPTDGKWTIYWVNSDTGYLQNPVSGTWSTDGPRFEATARTSSTGPLSSLATCGTPSRRRPRPGNRPSPSTMALPGRPTGS